MGHSRGPLENKNSDMNVDNGRPVPEVSGGAKDFAKNQDGAISAVFGLRIAVSRSGKGCRIICD